MEFSQQFAAYVEGVCLEQIRPQEVNAAKVALLDYLGVALAGVGEGPGQVLWSHRVSGEKAASLAAPKNGGGHVH